MRTTDDTVPLTADGLLDIPALLERNRQLYGDFQMTMPPEPPAPPAPPAPAPPAPAPPAPAPPAPPAPTPPTDRGYPENTPVAEMSTEQQAAYWKFHARKHEDAVKNMSDYEALKQKAAEFDALQEASATEQEKAINAAKAEGLREAALAAVPRIVRAEFRAAAAGRITSEQLDTILEPLDLTKFLTDKGEVDEVKVKTYVDGLAPAGGGKGGQPGMGQGRQTGSGKLAGREAGLAEAQKRFPQTAAKQ